MAAASRDFDALASTLLSGGDATLRAWFPAGRMVSQSWVVGSLKGEAGDGLTIDLSDGTWFDAPSGGSGGDLVSLYAAQHGIPDTAAYDRLTKPRVKCKAHPEIDMPAEAGAPPGFCSVHCATQHAQEQADYAAGLKEAETVFTQPTGTKGNASVGYTKPAAPTLRIVGGVDGNTARRADPTKVISDSRPLAMRWQELGLALAGNGQPYNNLSNALQIVRQELAGKVWFDTFHKDYFIAWNGPARPMKEADVLGLTVYMQSHLGMSKMSDDLVAKALAVAGMKDERNEVQTWLNGLQWDGEPRVRDFFARYFAAPSRSEGYVSAVSVNFWAGLAARIMRPGCKMDNMVVLEGKQGAGKTRAIEAIGGPWYASVHIDVQNKDFQLAIQGKLVIEISELQSFRRADFTAIKKILSDTIDRFRPPYGRNSLDFNRQCIFVGSTNEDTYLADPTGGRRFWPLHCGENIDVEGIKRDREQLFAEAKQLVVEGFSYFNAPDGAEDEQDERRIADVWSNRISDWVRYKDEVRLEDVMEQCLEIPVSRHDMKAQFRVGDVLRGMGWRKAIRGNPRRRVWEAPGRPVQHTLAQTDADDDAF